MALVIGGGLSLWLGAEAVFLSAVEMAERLHISEFIIGLTIIAIGTSLPELAASVAAALRKEADLITGNIVGSNLFNMLLIGGTVGTVTPFDVHSSFFRFEFPAMLALTLLLWIQVISQKTITRSEAVLLLAVYGGILGMSAWIQSPM
jgi:cation:H+ antiporter